MIYFGESFTTITCYELRVIYCVGGGGGIWLIWESNKVLIIPIPVLPGEIAMQLKV